MTGFLCDYWLRLEPGSHYQLHKHMVYKYWFIMDDDSDLGIPQLGEHLRHKTSLEHV